MSHEFKIGDAVEVNRVYPEDIRKVSLGSRGIVVTVKPDRLLVAFDPSETVTGKPISEWPLSPHQVRLIETGRILHEDD